MNVASRRLALCRPLRRFPDCPATPAATTTTTTTTTVRRVTTTTQPLCCESKVPQEPHVVPTPPPKAPPKPQVDLRLVQLLEKLSLVDFANKEGIERLEAAIGMADQLIQVDTAGVEPLITVLEDRSLPLAEDEVLHGSQKEELLACAHTTLDDYFVVPPGNITYEEERSYHASLKQQHQEEEE
ncbi:glutamyl-tRNA(Gln) amidotransferase subunit C, mitochondrial-like isoform X2 [Scylla paramamosain]|uniref:glutamyl-tRNA(Gln) amidotransferase subunit C, mitochondrial-like isoform X2 n=1 Tax=Scylla paramamosain TaxID=85552 RepID=UPI003082F2A1